MPECILAILTYLTRDQQKTQPKLGPLGTYVVYEKCKYHLTLTFGSISYFLKKCKPLHFLESVGASVLYFSCRHQIATLVSNKRGKSEHSPIYREKGSG